MEISHNLKLKTVPPSGVDLWCGVCRGQRVMYDDVTGDADLTLIDPPHLTSPQPKLAHLPPDEITHWAGHPQYFISNFSQGEY